MTEKRGDAVCVDDGMTQAWALDSVCRQDFPSVCARSLRYSRQALDQWRDALVEMGAHDGTA